MTSFCEPPPQDRPKDDVTWKTLHDWLFRFGQFICRLLPLSISNGGTGQTTPQSAINALTQVKTATSGFVLTKDPATGNADWQPGGGGSGLVNSVSTTDPALTISPTTGAVVISSNNFVGDSGSGGVHGEVPAPAAGDAAAGKFLKADGTWETMAAMSAGTLWQYRANTGATSGYPNDGHLLWDNATQTSATHLDFSHITQDVLDIDLLLALVNSGTTIVLQDANDSLNFQKWLTTGAGVNTNPGTSTSYWTYPVSLTSSGGTGTTGFPNNHQLAVFIIRAGNVGTVTSVNATVPAEFAVGGVPITGSGTIAITKVNESANTVWAGPTSGGAAQPTFRSLVTADMPSGTGTVTSIATTAPITGGTITTTGTIGITDFVASGASHARGAVPDPGASAGTTKFLCEDATFKIPPGTSTGTVTSIATTAPITGGTITTTGTIGVNDFVASGASHARGTVPDPGASAGTTKFLCEDATFKIPGASSGGSFVLITQSTANNTSTTVAFPNVFTSTYDQYFVLIESLDNATNATTVNITFSTDGSTYLNANYQMAVSGLDTASGAINLGTASAAQIQPITVAKNNGAFFTSGYFYFFNVNDTGSGKLMGMFLESMSNSTGNLTFRHGVGGNTTTSALTGFQIATGAGNWVSGRVSIYGIAH